ncbi:hypertrehalosaemic prohormone [Orussus abietinus]|uniref:hypertrehalosaemic prohormone n=1 Tax=Orussus abietinus TaxID=222816 RepID=UPI0006263090|nr:hypertrehalosaemic prohormone [Orussus abietinus]
MCRKIPSGLLAVVLLVCLILVTNVEAQLNFSTGWGKRSQILSTRGGNSPCSSQGRPTLDQLLGLYNLIQAEAQKIVDCQKLTK